MKGYEHTYGQEREYPEVLAVRKTAAEVLAMYKHNPAEEAERLKRNDEKTAETMREEGSFWLKYMGCMAAGVALITLLIANYNG